MATLNAHWKFNGSSWEEENDLHGTDTGITYGPGIDDLSAGFGAVKSTIVVGSNSKINNLFNGGGSAAFWFYMDDSSSDNYVLNKGNASWYIRIGGSGIITFFQLFDSNGGGWLVSSLIPLNKWTHITIVYDNALTTNNPTLYINGSTVNMTEASTPVGTPNDDIGDQLNFCNLSGNFGHCKLDDVRLYTGELTAGEISTLYGTYSTRQPLATIGNKEIKTAWPVTDGLVARTTKQTGRTTNLVPEEPTKVRLHQRWALGGR